MRDGFKIYDSDTHPSPMAETLEPYFDAAMRKRLPEWESCKGPIRAVGRRKFSNRRIATATSSKNDPAGARSCGFWEKRESNSSPRHYSRLVSTPARVSPRASVRHF